MTTPTPAAPAVSVILAVRDGWDQTFQTLLALVEAGAGLPVETIAVDDGSTDETEGALPRMPGLVTVRADRPQGLVRARNQGAALARGGILVFLGNGATPVAGWLAPLLAAFEREPDLAAAQPASSPLASDGLAVRAEVFRRLGGLDPAFRDRLAELDLTFRVEDLGLRLAQVPESRLEVAAPWGAGLPPWPADEALFTTRWSQRLAGPAPAATAPATVRPAVRPGGGPQFSVMVPCYNQAHFLTAALDSLLAQTCGDWEALVVDDGSTDDTSAVAARYAARDPRIRPFRKPNGGVASALNRALAEARGEWICWLSADDLFLPDKLAIHREAIRADPGLRFMQTQFQLHWEVDGRRTVSGFDPAAGLPPVEQQVIRLLHYNYFNGITICGHRSVLEAAGGFDEEFRYGQDYDLWLRISAMVRTRFLDRETSVTRLHPGQGTALFSEAGIYDSARAAAAFLIRHPFQALFPALDLDRPDQALQAAVAAIRVLLDPTAYVVRCGFSSLLQDRLHEWLAGASPAAREQVRRALGQALQRADTDETAADIVRGLLAVPAGGFTFEPVEPMALLQRHVLRVEARGDAKELAALRRYLKMVAVTGQRGLEAAAP